MLQQNPWIPMSVHGYFECACLMCVVSVCLFLPHQITSSKGIVSQASNSNTGYCDHDPTCVLEARPIHGEEHGHNIQCYYF